jgi:hypothetical protein
VAIAVCRERIRQSQKEDGDTDVWKKAGERKQPIEREREQEERYAKRQRPDEEPSGTDASEAPTPTEDRSRKSDKQSGPFKQESNSPSTVSSDPAGSSETTSLPKQGGKKRSSDETRIEDKTDDENKWFKSMAYPTPFSPDLPAPCSQVQSHIKRCSTEEQQQDERRGQPFKENPTDNKRGRDHEDDDEERSRPGKYKTLGVEDEESGKWKCNCCVYLPMIRRVVDAGTF